MNSTLFNTLFRFSVDEENVVTRLKIKNIQGNTNGIQEVMLVLNVKI